MNDFERRLQDALKNATSDYRPTDPHEAKARFRARFRRRRYTFYGGSVALAGAAAVAAFLLLPGQLSQRAEEPLPPATELPPQELSVIQVGADSSGIAFGADMVWVANTADGTIQVIDPLTNRVAETHRIGGSPDDVAVGLGAAWASDSSAGIVTKMVFGQPDGPGIVVGGPGRHLDVAPGSGAIWVVSEDNSLYRIDPSTNEVIPVETSGIEGISDVAAGQSRVIVLGKNALASIDPVSLIVTRIADVDASGNQDLQLSEGAVWVANGDAGEVTRFDLDTGEASEPVYVGGNFSAVASGEGSMWMVSGDEGADGVLTRIDPASAEIVGERVGLGGHPYDVTTGAGSVWIVNNAGSVTRLDPNALPEGDQTPEEMGRPLFAFAADGEIYVEDVEGNLTRVTDTREEERYPSLAPDANSIAFQRGPGDPTTEVVILDLLTGDEALLDDGEWPSFGPDGRVAYVVQNRGTTTRIIIERPGADGSVSIDPDPGLSPNSPIDVRNLAWDLTGGHLYFEAGWEGFDLFQVATDGNSDAFMLSPRNRHRGAGLAAPFVRGRDSVHVLQACCYEQGEGPNNPYETAEIGLIRFAEGGPQYSTVVELEPRRFPPGAVAVGSTLAGAGHLTLAGGSSEQRNWRQGRARSWLISLSDAIWLVDERGDVSLVSDLFDFNEYAGVSVAPQYRQ